MADASNPNPAAGTGAGASSGDGTPAERMYTQAEVDALIRQRVERAVKDRLRDKPALDEVEAEKAKLAKRVEELEDAQRTEIEKLTRRITKTQDEAKAREAELTAQVKATEEAHAKTRIRHALLGVVATKKLLEPEMITDALLPRFTVAKDGRVVSVNEDGVERTPDAIVDEWAKAHSTFIPAPPGGSGSPAARAAAGAKPDLAGMSSGELLARGIESRNQRGWGAAGQPASTTMPAPGK